ncbi:hypothetical protein ABER75_05795 [Niallia taxi]|nr:hypothetical protein [Niallia taxi]MCM3214567.1 hypothetical protein [Niallia taxi]MDK8642527.1 hypothetical protein [Niallia taxi]MED4040329.1 hypothetical protein [Niallia taxi]MED4056263.1 hypothetical protein [Niallia taxi]MED4119748.1 hypothetical protein [Niallia taxi]
MKYRKRKQGKFKDFLKESLFEIVLEGIWNIITFIPRMLIRFIVDHW